MKNYYSLYKKYNSGLLSKSWIGRLYYRLLKRIFFPACDIPFTVKIGDNAYFPHGATGVVIQEKATIGNNCTIHVNCVIAGKDGKIPVIGNNVTIGAGSIILGAKIGNNSKIGANAVVTKDVTDNCIVVGIPAKSLQSLSQG